MRAADGREEHLSRELATRLRDVHVDVVPALFLLNELAEIFRAHEAPEASRALLDVHVLEVGAFETPAASRTTNLVRGRIDPRRARFTAVRAPIERRGDRVDAAPARHAGRFCAAPRARSVCVALTTAIEATGLLHAPRIQRP